MEDDMRIVTRCDDKAHLVAAVEANRGAVILLSSELRVDLAALLAKSIQMDSRVILLTEDWVEPGKESLSQLDGVVSRNIPGSELVDTIRQIACGLRCVRCDSVITSPVSDLIGERLRNRLTPKEMQIVALIVQG